jgi:acetylornithine/N-succinyldiaminopimelate aminotransferase
MNDYSALMTITDRPPVTMVRGEGSWLWDHTGKRYLDFVQGWAVNCLGHAPKVMAEALAHQASQLVNCSPAFYNAPMGELARLIADGSGLDKVFFANTGAEANEGAFKLARKWGQLHRQGAYEIITFHGGFHGRTLAAMSASGKPQWEKLFEPKVPGFVKRPLNDLAAVEAAIGPRTVAVMLEPVQGESGVMPASDGFLRGLRELTKEKGILLIFDEVQTGIGRTGKMFAFQHLDFLPDIITLAKGLGGGVPLAALVAREDVCCFEPGDQGGTFNGNPLMTAVGCAVVKKVMQPAFLEHVRETGFYLEERLRALSRHFGLGEVRGRGLLVALVLGRDVSREVVARAMEQGVLLNAPRPDVLRFMPALNVSRAEVDLMLDCLSDTLAAVFGKEAPARQS